MKRDQACLFDIAEAARLAASYVEQTTKEEFLSDTKTQDSVIRRLEIIGVTVSAGEEAVVFSSAAVEASFDEIIKRGYVTEIKNGQRTGSDKSGGSDDGGCFIKNIQEKPTS